jgi:hypothetical protein
MVKKGIVADTGGLYTVLTGGQMMIHDPDELIYDIA